MGYPALRFGSSITSRSRTAQLCARTRDSPAPVPRDYSHLSERRRELCQQAPHALKPLSAPACRALQKRKPQSGETFLVFAPDERSVRAGARCGERVRVGKAKIVTSPRHRASAISSQRGKRDRDSWSRHNLCLGSQGGLWRGQPELCSPAASPEPTPRAVKRSHPCALQELYGFLPQPEPEARSDSRPTKTGAYRAKTLCFPCPGRLFNRAQDLCSNNKNERGKRRLFAGSCSLWQAACPASACSAPLVKPCKSPHNACSPRVNPAPASPGIVTWLESVSES